MISKAKRNKLLIQITLLFVAGTLLLGALSYQLSRAVAYTFAMDALLDRGEDTATEVEGYLNQYPAHEWLLRYWYEHLDELDVEYDAGYGTTSP